jgi:flagellar basal-body rod protein FlgG
MLQSTIYTASQHGVQQFEVLEKVSRNIANLNTTGYKAQRFQQVMDIHGRVTGVVRTDTSPGMSVITRRPLDVAIEGSGYFMVTQPDGKVAYTRDGSFTVDANRYLVTQQGDLVGTGIQIPTHYDKLMIFPDGTVQVREKPNEQTKTLGKLTLVAFPNPEGLASEGANKLTETAESGAPLHQAHAKLAQGKLERSNVAIPDQIETVLRLNAGVISNFRIIKFSDDLFRQAVNLKQ